MHQQQPDIWPLERGDTLSNHDWFPWYGHRFLASDFVGKAVLSDRRADIGTAVILWSEAMRQDPAGTLPEDDESLAYLARFQSVDDWMEVRDGVLRGWVPVLVRDGRSGETLTRLGHPGFMLGIVEEMHRRKRSRDGAREAGRLAQRKSRIRKKMSDIRIPDHIIGDDRVIQTLAEYFDQADLYVTPDNLRDAMIECIGYTGEIRQFPGMRGAG